MHLIGGGGSHWKTSTTASSLPSSDNIEMTRTVIDATTMAVTHLLYHGVRFSSSGLFFNTTQFTVVSAPKMLLLQLTYVATTNS